MHLAEKALWHPVIVLLQWPVLHLWQLTHSLGPTNTYRFCTLLAFHDPCWRSSAWSSPLSIFWKLSSCSIVPKQLKTKHVGHVGCFYRQYCLVKYSQMTGDDCCVYKIIRKCSLLNSQQNFFLGIFHIFTNQQSDTVCNIFIEQTS